MKTVTMLTKTENSDDLENYSGGATPEKQISLS
jgi:hypothetical protein